MINIGKVWEEIETISNIEINETNVKHYKSLYEYYNRLFSGFLAGKEVNSGYVEVFIVNRVYYSNDTDFI